MRFGPILILISTLLLSPLAWAGESCSAVLYNGGGNSQSNYLEHLEQIKAFYESLKKRGCKDQNIIVLSASGSRTANDFTDEWYPSPGAPGVKGDYSFLGKNVQMLPATREGLSQALTSLGGKSDSSNGELLFVLLDHGGTGGVTSWQNSPISPEEIEFLISSHGGLSEKKIKMWTECCYCGQFNRIKLKNGCVASSTDEGHVGDYGLRWWAKFEELIGTRYFDRLSNSFATSISSQPRASFLENATEAQLATNNRAFNSSAESYGDVVIEYGKCRIGARNSAESFQQEVIGVGSKPICIEDLLKKMSSSFENRSSTCPCCFENHNLDTLLELSNFLQSASNSVMSDTVRRDFQNIANFVKRSPEYRRLQELDVRFKTMDELTRIRSARQLQGQARSLKDALYKKVVSAFGRKIDQNWQQVLDALFNKVATPAQKAELERRRQCLSEPFL